MQGCFHVLDFAESFTATETRPAGFARSLFSNTLALMVVPQRATDKLATEKERGSCCHILLANLVLRQALKLLQRARSQSLYSKHPVM